MNNFVIDYNCWLTLPPHTNLKDFFISKPNEPSIAISSARAAINSSIFLATYEFIVRVSICLLRNVFKRDEVWHSFFAGCASALALYLEEPKRVIELALYCSPRAIEAVFKLMVQHGYAKSWKYGEEFLFCIASSILMYNYQYEKNNFRHTYYRFVRYVLGLN